METFLNVVKVYNLIVTHPLPLELKIFKGLGTNGNFLLSGKFGEASAHNALHTDTGQYNTGHTIIGSGQ